MPQITFIKEQYTIDVPEGVNLRTVMMDNSVQVYKGIGKIINCRGNGMCGQCRVSVMPDDNVTERTVRERAKLFLGDKRLACQIEVNGDIRVTTFHNSAMPANASPPSDD